MGFNLQIGEAVIDCDADYCTISLSVIDEEHEDAPAFGEPTDRSNQRWPSYSNWHNFIEKFNLSDVFNDEEKGLLREHPGISLITQWHKKRIDEEYEAFMRRYPNAKASYETDSLNDEYLVRMVWLRYWVDWALSNCKVPSFYNS